MEKCKFCQQELDEGTTLCPHCGKDNAELVEETLETPVSEPAEEAVESPVPEAEEVSAETNADVSAEKKAAPGKIALAVTAVVLLAAILVALIVVGVQGKNGTAELPETTVAGETVEATEIPSTVPEDGNPDDATAKGTYTVSDEEALAARDTVIATIGEHELTNGQLQVYYWSAVNSFLNSQQGYYLMMYGALDYTKPLDTQICAVDPSITWQQHFLKQALRNWHTSCALAAEAGKAGLEMAQEDREFLDNLETYFAETAEKYGMTTDELMLRNVGPGAGMEEFKFYQEQYSKGVVFYSAEIEKLVPTAEELEEFYDAHADEYAQGGITKDARAVNVRHILATIQGGTTDENGVTTYSDEEWAACEAEAQAILDEFLAGDKTEESFAALANEKSQDPGSNTNGGLYEDVVMGMMVKPFEDWCFDETRVYGDTGLVKTDYGYHVMYFVGSTLQWEIYARQDWVLEKTNEFIDALIESYPMEVTYGDIVLGYLDLAQ